MLRQPRQLRQSFAEEVLGAPDRARPSRSGCSASRVDVRLSYLEDVVAYDPATPREQVWMLRQSDEVCASYIDEVLLAED